MAVLLKENQSQRPLVPALKPEYRKKSLSTGRATRDVGQVGEGVGIDFKASGDSELGDARHGPWSQEAHDRELDSNLASFRSSLAG